MRLLLIVMFMLLGLVLSQNTTNCTQPNLEIKLVSNRNFILYYYLNQNCKQNPKINYCKLTNCKLNVRGVCYQYEVYVEENETICKERSCYEISVIDMNLFSKFDCNSVQFVGKSQFKKKNTAKMDEILNNKQVDVQKQTVQQIQTNKSYTLIIILSIALFLLIVGGISVYCKFYRTKQGQSFIDKNMEQIQTQVNTQKPFTPVKGSQQEKFERKWHLPSQSQVCRQVQLLSAECEICFNQKPNCTLPCNYRFHKRCVQDKIDNYVICPKCQSANCQLITVRCQKCLIYRYECSLAQLKQFIQTEDICETCCLV